MIKILLLLLYHYAHNGNNDTFYFIFSLWCNNPTAKSITAIKAI